MITEEKKDIFTIDMDYYLAYFVSRDCSMNQGIPGLFQEKYGVRPLLAKEILQNKLVCPGCALTGRIFNVIAKTYSSYKITYENLEASLNIMKDLAKKNGIKKIAMLKMSFDSDGLEWSEASKVLSSVFSDSSISILVCN